MFLAETSGSGTSQGTSELQAFVCALLKGQVLNLFLSLPACLDFAIPN
jgi:hypothetical protein